MGVDAGMIIKDLAETGRFVSRYFVGRGSELDLFAFDAEGGARLVWLHGLHRVGKSYLASKLLERSRNRGVKTAHIDLTDVREQHFETLLRRMQAALECVGVQIGSDTRAGLEALAARPGGPTVRLVLDELDHAAIHMSSDEQAFLRKVLESGENLGLIAVTRIDPAHIVEKIPDVRSYLLQNAHPRKIKPLTRIEVSKLFELIATDLEMPAFAEVSDRVFDLVGGHPQSVRRLAVALIRRRDELTNADAIEEALFDAKPDVIPKLRSLWQDVHPRTRQILLNGLPKGERQDVEGFTTGVPPNLRLTRPEWLIEVGEEIGVVPIRGPDPTTTPLLGVVQRIFELIYEINRRAESRPPENRTWFHQTTDTLQWYELLRAIDSESGFRSALNYLYKTLYEGPRTRVKAWRIPEPACSVYSKHPAVGTLSDLRNFFHHSQDIDRAEDARRKDADDAGKRFMYLIKDTHPKTADWSRARDALVRNLADALEQLLAAM